MWRITAFHKRPDGGSRAMAVATWMDGLFQPTAEAMRASGAVCAIANLPFDPPVASLKDDFDAVAEYWFGDRDQALGALRDARALASGFAAAPENPVPWLGEVRPVLHDGPIGIKVIRAGRPAKGVETHEALAYWRDHHPRVAQTATAFWALLTRYTQVPGADPDDPLSYPLQADVGAASIVDMVAAFGHPEYFSIVQPDERKFSLAGQLVSERLYFAASREVYAYDDRVAPAGRN